MKQRGMTLVEMLIVIGTLVVIFGLTLGIAGESEKTTRRIVRQQAALQFCQQAMDQAARLVRSAVDPRELNLPSLAGQLQFKADELTFPTYAGDQDRALRIITLRNNQPSPELPNQLTQVIQVLDPATGLPRQERRDDLARLHAEGFAPRIRFGYATTVEPGENVTYNDTWTSGGLPRLVQITVEAALGDTDTTRSLKLQTSVIPGLLPAEGAQP
jgi:type II secretory pathway pseudopilin PulG